MPYQNNIPQATDRIKDSQSDILGNFAAIKTLVDINHVTFDIADQGKHKWVSMPVQAASPATLPGEMALYTKTSTYTTEPEIYLRRQTTGTEVEFSSGLLANQGWCYLPSGILLKWGNGIANGLTTITFPAAATIPPFTVIYNIIVCTGYNSVPDGDGFVRLNNFAAPWTQFTVYGSQRTAVVDQAVGFRYLAIGS